MKEKVEQCEKRPDLSRGQEWEGLFQKLPYGSDCWTNTWKVSSSQSGKYGKRAIWIQGVAWDGMEHGRWEEILKEDYGSWSTASEKALEGLWHPAKDQENEWQILQERESSLHLGSWESQEANPEEEDLDRTLKSRTNYPEFSKYVDQRRKFARILRCLQQDLPDSVKSNEKRSVRQISI